MSGLPPTTQTDRPLLITKLYVPQTRPTLVPRPHLIQRLDEGMTRRLTLISAPTGFGKTTLLSEWAAGSELGSRVAWLSLDKGDNDPARFLTYLVAALQTLQAGVGETALAALRSPQPLPFEALLTPLINEIAALPAGLALILDDYHVITASPVHQALTFLLDHLPPRMHLFVATRADPQLPLARLRAQGQLVELRAADLRFTLDEATLLLNQVLGLGLSVPDVAALEARTEGWVAAMQLAALSMQGRDDVSAFVAALGGSHRYLLDYLAAEVLDRQPQSVRTFLLRTSILDRLTAPLCEALTDRSDGQATLEHLEWANLFVVPLDDERRWYRYHHLFADFLRHWLGRERPEGVPELHRRASAWYAQQGWLDEAIGHALAADDWERAASLIEQVAETTWTEGKVATLLRWLEALPAAQVRAHPRLCLAHAWALFLSGRLEAVEPNLQAAEHALGPNLTPAEREGVLGRVAAIRASVATIQGDIPQAVTLCQQALQLLSDEDLVWRGVALIGLGLAQQGRGDLSGASRALAEASAVSQEAGNLFTALFALSNLAQLQALQGQLHRAAETCRQGLELASERGAGGLAITGWLYVRWSEISYAWNDLASARQYALEGLERGEAGRELGVLASGHLILARVHLAQGDLAGARRELKQADRFAQQSNVPELVAQVQVAWAELWLAQGDRAAIDRWVRERGLEAGSAPDPRREAEYLTFARALVARKEFDAALAHLRPLQGAAEAAGRLGSVIEILILQALALQAQGDTAAALPLFERALALAAPQDQVRVFVDRGPAVTGLLWQVVTQHSLPPEAGPDYVERLMAALGADPDVVRARDAALVEPLSARELQVLRLIADGRSNREIAQELVITVGTVKRHVHNLYGKLDAHSRVQATERGRTLGLLPAVPLSASESTP